MEVVSVEISLHFHSFINSFINELMNESHTLLLLPKGGTTNLKVGGGVIALEGRGGMVNTVKH